MTSLVASVLSPVMTTSVMSAINTSPPGSSLAGYVVTGPAGMARPEILASPGHSPSLPSSGRKVGRAGRSEDPSSDPPLCGRQSSNRSADHRRQTRIRCPRSAASRRRAQLQSSCGDQRGRAAVPGPRTPIPTARWRSTSARPQPIGSSRPALGIDQAQAKPHRREIPNSTPSLRNSSGCQLGDPS